MISRHPLQVDFYIWIDICRLNQKYVKPHVHEWKTCSDAQCHVGANYFDGDFLKLRSYSLLFKTRLNSKTNI